jgi:hypothetical protein
MKQRSSSSSGFCEYCLHMHVRGHQEGHHRSCLQTVSCQAELAGASSPSSSAAAAAVARQVTSTDVRMASASAFPSSAAKGGTGGMCYSSGRWCQQAWDMPLHEPSHCQLSGRWVQGNCQIAGSATATVVPSAAWLSWGLVHGGHQQLLKACV